MSEVTLFGFPHSSFVHIAQLVLMHKEVLYTFYDLELDMGSLKHFALHPFEDEAANKRLELWFELERDLPMPADVAALTEQVLAELALVNQDFRE